MALRRKSSNEWWKRKEGKHQNQPNANKRNFLLWKQYCLLIFIWQLTYMRVQAARQPTSPLGRHFKTNYTISQSVVIFVIQHKKWEMIVDEIFYISSLSNPNIAHFYSNQDHLYLSINIYVSAYLSKGILKSNRKPVIIGVHSGTILQDFLHCQWKVVQNPSTRREWLWLSLQEKGE